MEGELMRYLLLLLLPVIASAQMSISSPFYQAAFLKPAAAGGGGGGFDPDAPTAFWWANSTISGSDGALWTAWTDSSGNGNSLSTIATQEPYVTNSVENGKAAIRFLTSKAMNSSFDLVVPYTIAGVMRVDTTGNDRRALKSGTQNRVLSFERASAANVYLGSTVASYSPPASTAHVFVLNVWPSGAEYWIDGTNRTTTAGVTGDWPDIGLGHNNSEPSLHYIFDIRGFTNGLTTNDMNTLAHTLTNIAGRWTDVP
jgi:hypothetical protein